MAKKYKNSEELNNPSSGADSAYVTWGTEAERKDALTESSKALGEYRIIAHTPRPASASRYRSFKDLDTNISGRPGLTRNHYDAFRPDEKVPTSPRGIISAAEYAYQKVGLIRNIIDLMGDFACQGIRLVHPNKKIEKFYQHWFKRVNGKERSERFLNNLYRTGNVVIRKQTAKINSRTERELYKTFADPETNIQNFKVSRREIPWQYIFLNPGTIEVIGGELAAFTGETRYAINLGTSLKKLIASPKEDIEREMVNKLPKEIIQAATSGKAYPLPKDKTRVFHYKKDDWQTWAHPMIYAILDDVMLLEKLKLADTAALDGAISNIRIFKLGNLDHKIAPTAAAASKLADILENHVGGGTTDLVWGPDIELVESKTAVHQFLGQEKYVPTLNSIYAGLGIPPTLTGLSNVGGGLTNNFMSLKTLVERLEYGRSVLNSFWEKEIVEIQKAMGFRFPARVEFEKMTLANEDAEKALLIQLADRNLISEESLQRKFGDDSEMERIRINREKKSRESGRYPEKSGPFHDANTDSSLKKIALQSGIATPSEVGLQLEERKDGEVTPNEQKQAETQTTPIQEKSPSGEPGEGRPKNMKDTKPRKPRVVKAVLQSQAKIAQEKISKIINPLVLELYNKKDLRSLSSAEFQESESLKFNALINLPSLSLVNPQSVHTALQAAIPTDIRDAYSSIVTDFVSSIGREPSTEENRNIQAMIYSEYRKS
tara:strand:+ start:141 stop:2291 length:2151 start_codon:yes stop_codon:yes gene_type:complete